MKHDKQNNPFRFRNSEKLSAAMKRYKLREGLRTFFTQDVIAKLCCVFAAICLWSYVIDTQSTNYEQSFSGVSVVFRNNDLNRTGFEVMSSDRTTVEVVLSGKRSVLGRLNHSDIDAYVDISHITEAGEYPLDIIVSTAKDVSVEEIYPKSMYVYVDKPSSRSVKVTAEYTGGTADDKLLKIGTLETSKSYITVRGPQEVLSTVACAEVTVDLQQISHSIHVRGVTPRLLDSDGNEIDNPYVTLVDKSMDVYVPIIMEKELPIAPKLLHGIFDESYITYTATPATVTLRGEIETLESLSAVYTAPVDETQIGSSQTLQLDYELPDGVTSVGTRTKCTMRLGIRDYRERQITYISRRITAQGLDDGLAVNITSPLYLSVCGPNEAVANLSASDIRATVALDGLTVGEYVDYPVDVTFASDEVRNAYIKNADKYTVSFTITESDDEPKQAASAQSANPNINTEGTVS